MFYAEFEPGLLIFLLWGLLSFLSRSKKKDDIPFKFDLSKESDNIQDISFDEQANNQLYFSESSEKELETKLAFFCSFVDGASEFLDLDMAEELMAYRC